MTCGRVRQTFFIRELLFVGHSFNIIQQTNLREGIFGAHLVFQLDFIELSA